MSFFYDLNKKLNSIGNEQEQIAKEVAKAANKSPVRKSLEESLRSDMKALMEDGTGGMNFSGSGSLEENPTPEQAKLDPRYKTDPKFRKEVDAASQIGTNPNSLKETDKWIQKATKPSTKGDLHKALRVPQGEKIPKAKINKATHSKDEHLRHMAQFAKNVAKEDGGSEMECNTPTPSKGIPGNIPVPGKMDRLKGKRDYYETDDSEEDIMDYLNRKLAPHDKEQQTKEDAISNPYNGSAGDADAYNGMEFEGNAFTGKLKSTPKGEKFSVGGKEYTDTSELDETMTRQHFQHTADLLKHIEDPAKRMELAKHHAGVFKASNPRFDHGKFMKACNCDEGLGGAVVGGIGGALVGGPAGAIRGAQIGSAVGDALSSDESEVDEGWDEMDAWLKQREKEKGTGKFDKRKVSTGTVYTRRFDDEPTDDDTDAPASKGGNPAVKRGRGRPAGTKGATGARGPTGKSKLMAKDAMREEEVDEVCHHCGQAIQEKAVSKKQQKFMGMVHAAQKGEKPASKEVAKVAKGMKKKDAEDFASTKHKGLPEKVKAKKTEEGKGDGNLANNAKPYDKVTQGDVVAGRLGKDEEGGKKKFKKEEKVDETTTSGSVATASEAPKSSKGGMKFGGGIYDSWNRQYENLLAENVNVNTTATKNDDGQDHESITITVDGDDVSRFKELLQSMGVTQNHSHSGATHSEEPCGSCGGVPCQCDELGEMTNDDLAKLRADAAAGMKKSIDSQSDARIAALKNPPKEKSFMQQVGDKQIGMVKGAWKGLTGQNEEFELDEADAPVSQNEPDYPTNQEESDDALQYSGGLNRKKSTGQTTIPVVASQEDRLHTMEESVDSFLSLYQAFKTK